MDTLTIGPYTIEYDRRATIDAHARIAVPGPEACGCWHCRNWVEARALVVPTAIQSLLEQLGIQVEGETEVYEMPDGAGGHIYGGWYTFVGRITGPDREGSGPTVEGWTLHFSNGSRYAVDGFGGLRVSEMGFVVYGVDNFIEQERM